MKRVVPVALAALAAIALSAGPATARTPAQANPDPTVATTPGDATTPTTTATVTLTDVQLAATGVIDPSDLPESWTSSAPDVKQDRIRLKVASKTSGCDDFVDFATANAATTTATSNGYASGTGAHIDNHVYVHESKADAAAAMDAFATTSVPGCLSKVLATSLRRSVARDKEASASITDVTLKMQPVDMRGLGVPTVAYQGGLAITLRDGTRQDAALGLVAVQVGRVIVTYSFLAPSASTDLEPALAGALNGTLSRVYSVG